MAKEQKWERANSVKLINPLSIHKKARKWGVAHTAIAPGDSERTYVPKNLTMKIRLHRFKHAKKSHKIKVSRMFNFYLIAKNLSFLKDHHTIQILKSCLKYNLKF